MLELWCMLTKTVTMLELWCMLIKTVTMLELWCMLIKTVTIKVITKLPNSEQSYKGKVKTHNYINRQKSVNSRKTVKTVMTLTWYRHF